MVPIDRITPNPHNPRTHPPKQIRQIADSIHAFGFTSPLLVDEDLNLIAGHGRFAAALTLGMSEIPVLVLSGLSAAKRRALAIADNRIAEEAGWDRRRLAIEIPELTELLSLEQLDISILGFQPIEIEQNPPRSMNAMSARSAPITAWRCCSSPMTSASSARSPGRRGDAARPHRRGGKDGGGLRAAATRIYPRAARGRFFRGTPTDWLRSAKTERHNKQ